MGLTAVILGRPNVGKSTLFNRLTGSRAALVHPTPGVTRDRREGDARIGDLSFRLVDTAGLEEAAPDTLDGRMQAQTGRALDAADLVLLVVDAKAGLTPLDRHFAAQVRRQGKAVVLIANKCESVTASEAGRIEALALGLGAPVAISAEHGEGMTDLYDALRPYVDAAAAGDADARDEGAGDDAPDSEAAEDAAAAAPRGPLQFAVIGRPNVGKSTLINRLVGEERVVTGPEPGVTRDAVAIDWSFRGRDIRLIDTAGMRRKAKIHEKLEQLSVRDALGAVRHAHAVVLVIDAEQPLERQDLILARMIVDEGRAPVIAVNKWDLIADKREVRRAIDEKLAQSLPNARGVPVVPLSALKGTGANRLMPAVLKAVDQWNRRLPTGPLNRWFQDAIAAHSPPVVQGRRLKLRYITQVKARPPTFVIFASRPEALPESYARYLVNEIRQTFDLQGVPIRLALRRGRNPYGDKQHR